MLVHFRVTLSIEFAHSHLYTWLERDIVRVKCLVLEPGLIDSESSTRAIIMRQPCLHFQTIAEAASSSKYFISLQIIVPVIWVVAIVFNLPLLLTIHYNKQSARDFCTQYWPQQWMVKANTIVWCSVTGVIPITLMTVMYSRVVNALWFQNEDSSDNVRQVSYKFNMCRDSLPKAPRLALVLAS